MQDAFSDVREWIYKQHPQYDGWHMRSFAWEYDICELPQTIYHALYDEFDQHGEITLAMVQSHVERIQPPEGYAYVTLEKGATRVGFNVPKEVFQI